MNYLQEKWERQNAYSCLYYFQKLIYSIFGFTFVNGPIFQSREFALKKDYIKQNRLLTVEGEKNKQE